MAAPSLHVRPLTRADRSAVRDLALINNMFAPEDMTGFDEMLSGYLDATMPEHQWAVAVSEANPAIQGACYWAPEPFADRVWNLYFLAVDPAVHGRGAGSALVDHVVTILTSAGESIARVLIVETSSTDSYRRARHFYLARGFVQEATIREFYGPSDDKIVFWRRISG
ncbi:Acetyltransferase (GNAT) domain-containing protein [Lentzea albida]|uniref:Acetyltransferase (GNAT) domain-containing protein n=1 Tax=Lentzea albida TaxID=65499 RepID=A0A1H9PPY3_9PSEU|nr:Acetyltransferase (GNAT) domain-containing protein [Lentzea albida]